MDGERYPVDSLTARELEILRLVALGLSNRNERENKHDLTHLELLIMLQCYR